MNATTNAYKTKTKIHKRKNVSVKNTWGIALDIGYSAVKGFSPNKAFIFPSFAKKVDAVPSLGSADETDIVLVDKLTGDIWLVGEFGQKMLDVKSKQSIYGRNRYFDPMFRVLAAAGLGMGMLANEFGQAGEKKIVLQTGLPPAYMADKMDLQDALAGEYNFSLKVGSDREVDFKFSLENKDIMVMPQPMGTLYSIATNDEGHAVPDAKKYFSSNLLIFDPGFGTLDVFDIKNRSIASHETWDNLGMREVFQRTVDEIYRTYRTEVSVSALQNYLAAGEVTVFERQHRRTTAKSFEKILVDKSREVCREALQKIGNLYEYLVNYQYIVVTGGTGAAWLPIIRDYYAEMTTLQLLNGNQNDNLSCVFANVRGYYMYLYGALARAQK